MIAVPKEILWTLITHTFYSGGMSYRCCTGVTVDCLMQLISNLVLNFLPQKVCYCGHCSSVMLLIKNWMN